MWGGTKIPSTVQVPEWPPVGKFRRYLPQILATMAKNLLLFDIGLTFAFPTIVIPAIRGIQPEKYPDETIYITASQATWYASIGTIGQIFGSTISGYVTEPLGRKRAMMIVNIPHIIAWILLFTAKSAWQMYLASVMLGFGTGIMEAPILTYVGEISEPAIRANLLSMSMIGAMLGYLFVYTLGFYLKWRNVALVCLLVPVVTVIAILFVPETPSWLLSKSRRDDAIKSLQWLRGWVPKEAVAVEFAQLEHDTELCKSCESCRMAKIPCTHIAIGFVGKLKMLFDYRTRRPFILMIAVFAVNSFGGNSSIKAYMVQIFQTFIIPVQPNVGTICISGVSLIANILCLCIIHFVGKRKIYLVSVVGCAISCLVLGIYALHHFPNMHSSFQSKKQPFNGSFIHYIPFTMFLGLAFFSNLGVYPVAFTLLSELFPFRTRGMATGFVIAISYIGSFIATKTYLDMENAFTVGGVFLFYATVNIFGFFYMYVFMPETENCTLEDIELYYSNPNRRPWDRTIPKSKEQSIDANIESAMNAISKLKKIEKIK